MILARSFWLDAGLVATSCLALVCLNQPVRLQWLVSVVDGKQPARTFCVAGEAASEAELRQSILQQSAPKFRPEWALMRWQHETAEFYAGLATANPSTPVAERFEPANSASRFPFRTASTRSASDPTWPSVGVKSWAGFWRARQARAERWLTQYEQHRDAMVRSIDEALVISMSIQWSDPRYFLGAGLIAACLAVVIATIWHRLDPPRSWQSRFEPLSARPCSSSDADQAEMCFRENWVRLRQPLGVMVRRGIGGGLVLAAIASSLSHLLRYHLIG